MSLRLSAVAVLAIALAACKAGQPADIATPASVSDAAAPALAAPPATTPVDEVKASMDAFWAAKSFHATMVLEGADTPTTTSEMDFVAPDRYRITMPMGTQVVIGDTMYMQMQGRTMKTPLPKGTLSQWRDPLKFGQSKEGIAVEALGADSVDGTPAKKYQVKVTRPEAAEFTYWIDGDGRPLKFEHEGNAQGKPFHMTARYSRFDDPGIRIEAPR